jgi:hypothetical protein
MVKAKTAQSWMAIQRAEIGDIVESAEEEPGKSRQVTDEVQLKAEMFREEIQLSELAECQER